LGRMRISKLSRHVSRLQWNIRRRTGEGEGTTLIRSRIEKSPVILPANQNYYGQQLQRCPYSSHERVIVVA